jgi:hypothetical protein
MDSGPSSPTIDPDKWRLLLPSLGLGLLMVMLLGLEGLFCWIGLYQTYWAAVLVGAGLLFILYFFLQTLDTWRRRPLGDGALRHAAATLAEFQSSSLIICREPPVGPSERKRALLTGLPFFAILLAPAAHHRWLLAAGLLAAALVVFGLGWYFLVTRAADRVPRVLKLDLVRRVAEFEHCTFQNSFWPCASTPRVEVSFAQILAASFTPGQKGAPGTLKVRTSKGPTSLPDTLTHFSSARSVLESAAILSYADPLERQTNLRAVPKVPVPLLGWLVIAALLAGLGTGIGYLLRLR